MSSRFPARRLALTAVLTAVAAASLPMLPSGTLVPPALAESKKTPVAGAWQGELKIGPQTLRLVFHIKQNDDGKWSGTFDSPDQGAIGIPLTDVDVRPGELSLRDDKAGFVFGGHFSEDGTTLEGSFKQAGMSLPLTLKKTDAPVTRQRKPQEPVPPYPYTSTEVTYKNDTSNLGLAGTLTTPATGGPFPAVILITGSGPQDRDETVFGHKPFLLIADYLTRHGFAVLRVDDRGIGGSGGDTANSTTADFATDVEAGLAFLRTRPEIDPQRIGLLGHSEGGAVGAMVAARHPDVAFLVMMAGPGVSGEEILLTQGEAISRASGATAEQAEASKKVQKDLYSIVKSEADPAIARAKLSATLHAIMAREGKSDDANAGAAVDAQVRALSSPWYRFFIPYDPRVDLAKVKCPVLAIDGDKDLQVDAKINLTAIGDTLKKAGNPDVTTKVFPGLNHLFQTAQTGLPAEYAPNNETMAPVVLETMGQWITAHTTRP